MATDEPQATVVDPDADLSVEDEYDDVADPDSPSHRLQDGKSKRSGLVEWIIVVAVAISSALLVRAYVLQQFAVEGTSMLTTLHPSDRVLVNKLSYRLHDPRRGDVVVLKRIETNSQERDLIKRVVGLPGRDHRVPRLPAVHQRVADQRAVPRSTDRCAEPLRRRPAGGPGSAEPCVRDGRQPRWFARQPRQQRRPGRLQQPDRPRLCGDVAIRRLAVAVAPRLVVRWPTDDWWTQAADQFGLETVQMPVTAGPPAVSPTQAPNDTALDDTVPEPRQRRRRRHPGIDWLVIAAIAVGAAFLLRLFVVQQFAVDGESMLGTLHSGDRVIVNKLSYVAHDPRHGDVVVLKDIKAHVEVRDLIKRVIALPGETIEYRDCQLLIDGRQVSEPYLDPNVVQPGNCGDPQPPVKVEPGHVFVMGDNRGASLDSRTAGSGRSRTTT